MKHPDGSIISQFFQTTDKPTSGDDIYDQGMRIMVGQVDKIHYVDDASNVSKKFVEYDVNVRDAKGGQSTLRNLRKVDLLGGSNDYDELILEASTFASTGKLETGNLFKNKNGTIVLIASLDGSKDKPVIFMAFQHPKRDGAKKADGIRRKGEFRGIQWEINKDGELIITQLGPRGADGKLQKSDSILTVAKFDKSGNVTLTDHAKNQIMLDNTSTKLTVQSDSKGTKIELDGANDKITIGTAKGLNVVIDGQGDKATFTTSGGPSISIDGSGMITITANSTIITIDGSSGKISLSGDLVDVGTGASALAVLGPQLIAWLSSHVHIGNLGAPTSPPVVPPPASLLSTSVKIKA